MGVSVYICENYTCEMVKIDHPRKLNLTKISHYRVATYMYICCYEWVAGLTLRDEMPDIEYFPYVDYCWLKYHNYHD